MPPYQSIDSCTDLRYKGVMAKSTKTLNERIADAEARASTALGNYNEAAERGQRVRAEKELEKAQYWLDRANKLRGNG